MTDAQAARLIALIEGLPAAIAAAMRQPTGRALSIADRSALARLLPAIYAAMGAATWTTRELIQHAKARDPDLLAGLEAILGNDINAKRLGKLLARSSGWVTEDVMVERVKRTRESVVWRTFLRR